MVVELRFLCSLLGVRIAYARQGDGPPLVCVPPWRTYLEAESQFKEHLTATTKSI